MSYVYIIPINTDASLWGRQLQKEIMGSFGLRSKFADIKIDLPKTFDNYRRQYNSSQILIQLIEKPPPDALKILGITEVDMFIPILTFVFGEAQLDGTGAVVSLHRLNNKFYGLPEDKKLLTQRLVKEAVHELGHTFGLIHCNNPPCVLISSTYVEDIDQKSHELCSQCQQHLLATKFLRPRIKAQGFDNTVLR